MDTFWIAIISANVVLFLAALVFAGLALFLRNRINRAAELWSRLETRWKKIVADYLRGELSGTEAHDRLELRHRLRFVDYISRNLDNRSGADRDRLRQLTDPYLPEIAARTTHGDREQRARATDTLGRLGGREYHDLLIKRLDDESLFVAMVAARHLADTGDPERLAEVLKRADRFESWGVHFLAGVVATPGQKIAPLLVSVFVNVEQTEFQRLVAGEAVCQLFYEKGAPAAREILARNESIELSAVSLKILSRVGSQEDLPLIRAFAESDDEILRVRAVEALAVIGAAEDIDRYRRAVEDESSWVALRGIWGLKHLGGVEAVRRYAESGGSRSLLARQVLQEARQ